MLPSPSLLPVQKLLQLPLVLVLMLWRKPMLLRLPSSGGFSSPCFQVPYKKAIEKCGSAAAPTFVPLFMGFCT